MSRRKFNLSWGQALAEILLIFIGITLAVAFNNWNEARKDAALREGYYQRILAELKQDRADLKDIITYHNYRKVAIDGLFQYLDKVNRPNADSLQPMVQALSYHMSSYVPNESTYQELISTGNIRLIKTEVREQLLRLSQMHSYVVETQQAFESQYEDRRHQMAEVIDEAAFYEIRKNPKPKALAWQRDVDSEGFRRYSNLLAVRHKIAMTMMSIYESVDQRCEALIALVEKETAE